MRYKVFIGTDEAGYGPNLGPLVITATSWKVPVDTECAELWSLLSDVLTNAPGRNDPRLFVADSKQVYSPTNGIVDLETAVLSLLGTIQLSPACTMDLGVQVAGDQFRGQCQLDPTLRSMTTSLPVAAFPDEVAEFQQQLAAAFLRSGIQLLRIKSRVVFPGEFNRLVSHAGSKGVVLSGCTLQLIHDLCPPQFRMAGQDNAARRRIRTLFAEDDEPSVSHVARTASTDECSFDNGAHPFLTDSVQVFCDKHGGRNRYDALISEQFDDQFVFRCEESTASSRYRMGRMEFCFRTRAEELLPVAVASMVSKYVREMLMEDFNQFWRSHLPDLKPTKGYPLDARRFRDAIQQTAERLGIEEAQFWRVK